MGKSFILFRLRLVSISSPQQKLLIQIDRGYLLKNILEAKPGFEVRKGSYWAVGNVVGVSTNAIAFKLGRKISREDPIYDEETRDFILGDVEESDCVDAFFDYKYQVLAIEKGTGLPEPWTLASYATKIINNSWEEFSYGLSAEEISCMRLLKAEYGTIRDTRDFINLIRSSYKVKRLTVSFSKPNAFTPQDFRKPLENHTEYLNGKRGTASFYADDDLDREATVATAKDASASGQDVSARIIDNEDATARVIKMEEKKHPLIVDVDDSESGTNIIRKIINTLKPLFEK